MNMSKLWIFLVAMTCQSLANASHDGPGVAKQPSRRSETATLREMRYECGSVPGAQMKLMIIIRAKYKIDISGKAKLVSVVETLNEEGKESRKFSVEERSEPHPTRPELTVRTWIGGGGIKVEGIINFQDPRRNFSARFFPPNSLDATNLACTY